MPKRLAMLQSTALWYVCYHLKSLWLQHVSPLLVYQTLQKAQDQPGGLCHAASHLSVHRSCSVWQACFSCSTSIYATRSC